MKITREIKTAILVIVSILMLIWGYRFVKGKDVWGAFTTVYVEYNNVEGLAVSAPVTQNGLRIGKVNDITINTKTGLLLVELRLNTEFPISKSSIAVLQDAGLMGGKRIAIIPNFQDKKMITDGDILKGNIDYGFIEQLSNKIEPLIDNADKFLYGVNNVLDEKGQDDLKKGLAGLRETIRQLNIASSGINFMIVENKNGVRDIVSNLTKMSDSLNRADISKTINSLQRNLVSMEKIMANIEAGKGSVGKFIKNDSLYDNLERSSKELELLLQDVRLSPSRYVHFSIFGKTSKPYKEHTKDTVKTK